MNGRVEYPTKHISIRVPWHDKEWNGEICENPHLNNSCTILKRIAEEKFDAREEENAGKSIEDLEERIWPPCVHERGMFMSPFDFTATMLHPYKRFSKLHKHFKPTYFHMAAHSASAVPFRWMLKSNINHFAEEYGLDCSEEYEPDIGFPSSFTQGFYNQKTLLDTFFGHVKSEESLCFFYAKNVPFVEERGRVLIGVGKVKKIGQPMEHLRINNNGIQSMIWERNIQHSIREGFEEGFILPYHEILEYCKENNDLDPSEIAVVVPDDHRMEFSFASEFVTPDAAINVLFKTIKALDKIKEYIPGPWTKCQNWIDEQLGELWKLRGPYPGLGSILRSFGIDLGNMIANEVNQMTKSGEDHWNILDEVFKDPKEYLAENLAMKIGRLHQKKWSKLSIERKSFLKLMSRFEIDIDQAKMFYNFENRENELIFCEDKEIIENPYLLYELSRFHPNFINFWRVDYGLFSDVSISKNYPIPEPSRMDYRLDERRIRAVLIYILEQGAREGHTLLPVAHLIDKINKLSIEPPFEIDSETLEIVEDDFEDLISIIKLKDGKKAYKLRYLEEMGNIIKKTVENRLSQDRILLDENWRELIDEVFDNDPLLNDKVDPVMEEEARKEKAKALETLSQSRFSVLIGPAGTGKTKLLSVLCNQEDIKNEGILLLAPTGKARVKIEEGVRNLGLKAQTLAQFLIKQDRFDWETGRYHLSDKKKISKAKTIIVDEASMISEDMLAALLDSLKGFKRLILVGDPNQLPPIGPGRPFVDIIKKIKNDAEELENSSVVELTVNIRHIDPDKDGKDLELAKWFSEDVPSSDDLSRIINKENYSNCISFKKWDSQDDFRDLILNSLVKEIDDIKSSKDYNGFNKSLGGVKQGNWTNYNANGIENWQILSPVRNHNHGVMEINRFIHKRFRGGLIYNLRKGKIKNSLKPLGNEEIIGGDKVINVLNHQRWCSDIEDYLINQWVI
ncbi:MAG: AAA family ATPase [Euryarchaeota archaeon]